MLIFDKVSIAFDGKNVITDFSKDLSVPHITVFRGPSGCGKTTLLNAIAGLVKLDSGRIITDKKPAYMFQEPRLFPWLTALENVNAVLSGKKETLEKAKSMLEKTGFYDFDKYPDELSGGMQKRVALARTLASDGDLLLLDEPLSALDEKSRTELLEVIKNDKRQIIIVSHDMTDTSIADEIVEIGI